MENLGIRLKNAIKNSGFKQKEIVELIGTTEKTLSTYTQGKALITAKMLGEICKIINVPVQEIIYGVDENNRNEIFINKFNHLKEDQQKIIIAQIEFLENQNRDNQMLSALKNTDEKSSENRGAG